MLGDDFSMFLDSGRSFFVKMLLGDDFSMFLDLRPGAMFFGKNGHLRCGSDGWKGLTEIFVGTDPNGELFFSKCCWATIF